MHTHSHQILGNIAEGFHSVPVELGAGKITHSTGPSEITHKKKQMVNPNQLPTLKALVRLPFALLKKDYLKSVLEQRHTRTFMLLKKYLNKGE